MSDLEMHRQIKAEGKDWDLVPMKGIRGNVLVGENILTKLPIAEGLFILEEVTWDICEISQEYPFSALLNNRLDREGRKKALSQEIYQHEKQRLEASKKDDLRRDMLDYYQFISGEKRSYMG